MKVCYKQQVVGFYVTDIVEQKLLIELKALPHLNQQHEAQVMNYLKATGLNVGLLLNFGTSKLGVRRIVWNTTIQREFKLRPFAFICVHLGTALIDLDESCLNVPT